MLLDGVNHVAILTKDTDRLVAFYREVFEAEVSDQEFDGAVRARGRGGRVDRP